MPKKIITTSFVVRRVDWTKYSQDCPRGSGYCEDQGSTQYLIKQYKFFNIKIWEKTIDKEEVPMHVLLEYCCLGATSWKSKFSSFM